MAKADGATARPEWKRTQAAVVAAVFVWFAGTNFVLPFLSLYVRELGDLTVAQTGVWSGFILSSTPLVSGALAPLWGRMADRYGRKLMVQRSLLGFAVCLGLMGLAQEPWHLLAARAAMGVFGGFGAASAALVTTTGPPHTVTSAVGRVEGARVLGLAIGPLPGGLLADWAGYRAACFVSMTGAIAAFLIVTFLAHADARPEGRPSQERKAATRRQLLAGGFLSVMVAALGVRLAEKSFDPVLPLLIAELGPSALGTASTTALITSAGLFAAALASSLTGRFVGDRQRDRGLRLALLAGALAFAALFAAATWWGILALRIVVGFALGMALTLAFATAAAETPQERRGLVLGVMGGGTAIGSSAGSALAGLLSPLSLSLVFLVDGGLLLTAAGLHRRGRRPADP